MKWEYMLIYFVLALFGIFLVVMGRRCAGRKEGVRCGNPFWSMAAGILWLLRWKPGRRDTWIITEWVDDHLSRIRSRLEKLYPGKDVAHMAETILIKRIAICCEIIAGGTVLAVILSLGMLQNRYLYDGGSILRGEYGSGDREVSLIAETDRYSEQIDLHLDERTYTEEELDAFLRQAEEVLPSVILGENDSIEHISKQLDLVRSLEGSPFRITWNSDHYSLVDCDGTVSNEELESPTPVQLTADLLYEEEHYLLTFPILVVPKEYTSAQQWRMRVEEALRVRQLETAEETKYVLPETVDGMEVAWSEKKEDHSIWLLIIAMFGAAALLLFGNRDLQIMLEERESILLNEYPELVSKLTLYLGAGLSIRNAVIHMGRVNPAGGKTAGPRAVAAKSVAGEAVSQNLLVKTSASENRGTDPLQEELTIVANELSAGISEPDAYERFGERCRLRQYVRFSAMINQNLKKGSNNLLETLRKESEEAFELQKSRARKAGEEAGTKLLLPMMMMLCVVMVIIMIPAYFSFAM